MTEEEMRLILAQAGPREPTEVEHSSDMLDMMLGEGENRLVAPEAPSDPRSKGFENRVDEMDRIFQGMNRPGGDAEVWDEARARRQAQDFRDQMRTDQFKYDKGSPHNPRGPGYFQGDEQSPDLPSQDEIDFRLSHPSDAVIEQFMRQFGPTRGEFPEGPPEGHVPVPLPRKPHMAPDDSGTMGMLDPAEIEGRLRKRDLEEFLKYYKGEGIPPRKIERDIPREYLPPGHRLYKPAEPEY